MERPVLRHIANLWTLMEHPTAADEWSLDQKLGAIREAGFDGVCWAGSPELREGLKRHGLLFVGGLASGNKAEFPRLLGEQKDCGAEQVNVQLGHDEMGTAEALDLTLTLLAESERSGLRAAIETHRGTCTETPEKTYALADAYRAATGRLLPLSIDWSHFGVVKHLTPDRFADRLLRRTDLIQLAQQFHLRPFNGHHCQVPVTDGRGELTPETRAWLPLAEATLRCWYRGNRTTAREVFVCPEMGPVCAGGYNLSVLPNSWEEAKRLRVEIERVWRHVVAME